MTTTATPHISLPVIPNGIGRPKFIAKELHRYFPFKKLSSCQETTAHLYGFKDWHALEVAINSSSPRGPFDEEVVGMPTLNDENNHLDKRLKQQIEIICNELKLNTESNFGDTPFGIHDLRQLQQDSADMYFFLLAREIVTSTPPTSKREYRPTKAFDLFCEFNCQQIEKLPLQISKWWKTNVPYQPEVGEALEKFKIDPMNKITILVFAQYWGTLSKYYADVIDEKLTIGISYILGKRWASVSVQQSFSFLDWFEALPIDRKELLVDASNFGTFYKIPKDMEDQFFEEMLYFYDAYPRVDFYIPFANQPDAFLQNARKAIKILYK